MARAQVLGNGHMAVCMDGEGVVRDIYYPHVGLENQVGGHRHRIGLWWDGQFSWLDSLDWQVTVSYENRSMLGQVVYQHKSLRMKVVVRSVVYNEIAVFVRSVTFHNPDSAVNKVRVFFGQEFEIGENRFRNTGFYDPTQNAVIHYKGRRVFLVNGVGPDGGINDYTVGMFGYEGKEGSFRDAEDGVLNKNAVEHGPVDSVIGFEANCKGKSTVEIYYWLCAGHTIDEVHKLNEVVVLKTPHGVMHSTTSFWQAWADTKKVNFYGLSEKQIKTYYDSLFVLRAHLDHKGGIIASLDSEMLINGKDSYAYVWPRDAAYVAISLDKAGYSTITKKFYEYCTQILHEDGYFHHKYLPDYSLGSTWQSTIIQKDWLKNKILQLPIQEDETATIVWGLWQHYLCSNDIEFIEEIYKPFIEKATEFMLEFRDMYTGLPIQSYDIWEEISGVSTYTCSAVCGGLMAASKFATILGKYNHAQRYTAAAEEIKKAMIRYLYDDELKSFVRGIHVEGVSMKKSKVIDASALFGMWYYDVFDKNDEHFVGTLNAVENRLKNSGEIGGYIRYDGDTYYQSGDTKQPNTWIVTTLWDLQRRMKFATDEKELAALGERLNWVVDRLQTYPLMAEQYHPRTGEALSATPLAWSHALYVETVLYFSERMEQLVRKEK